MLDDPLSLLSLGIWLFAAGMWPVGLLFGSCSSCCDVCPDPWFVPLIACIRHDFVSPQNEIIGGGHCLFVATRGADPELQATLGSGMQIRNAQSQIVIPIRATLSASGASRTPIGVTRTQTWRFNLSTAALPSVDVPAPPWHLQVDLIVTGVKQNQDVVEEFSQFGASIAEIRQNLEEIPEQLQLFEASLAEVEPPSVARETAEDEHGQPKLVLRVKQGRASITRDEQITLFPVGAQRWPRRLSGSSANATLVAGGPVSGWTVTKTLGIAIEERALAILASPCALPQGGLYGQSRYLFDSAAAEAFLNGDSLSLPPLQNGRSGILTIEPNSGPGAGLCTESRFSQGVALGVYPPTIGCLLSETLPCEGDAILELRADHEDRIAVTDGTGSTLCGRGGWAVDSQYEPSGIKTGDPTSITTLANFRINVPKREFYPGDTIRWDVQNGPSREQAVLSGRTFVLGATGSFNNPEFLNPIVPDGFSILDSRSQFPNTGPCLGIGGFYYRPRTGFFGMQPELRRVCAETIVDNSGLPAEVTTEWQFRCRGLLCCNEMSPFECVAGNATFDEFGNLIPGSICDAPIVASGSATFTAISAGAGPVVEDGPLLEGDYSDTAQFSGSATMLGDFCTSTLPGGQFQAGVFGTSPVAEPCEATGTRSLDLGIYILGDRSCSQAFWGGLVYRGTRGEVSLLCDETPSPDLPLTGTFTRRLPLRASCTDFEPSTLPPEGGTITRECTGGIIAGGLEERRVPGNNGLLPFQTSYGRGSPIVAASPECVLVSLVSRDNPVNNSLTPECSLLAPVINLVEQTGEPWGGFFFSLPTRNDRINCDSFNGNSPPNPCGCSISVNITAGAQYATVTVLGGFFIQVVANQKYELGQFVTFDVTCGNTISHTVGRPTITPSPPLNLSSVREPCGTVTLAWDAPYSEGVSPITGYRVEFQRIGGQWATFSTVTSLTAAVTGLARLGYRFRVFALSAAGASEPSNTTTQGFSLGPPTALAAVRGPCEQATLSWLPPMQSECIAVAGYRLEYRTVSPTGAVGNYILSGTVPGTQTTGVVTGLTPGDRYDFRIARIDDAETLSYAAATVRSGQPPAAPTNLQASLGGSLGEVELTWVALEETCFENTDYLVQFRLAAEATWTTYTRAASAEKAATVVGLSPGGSYVFRVRAVNSVGSGNFSTASGIVSIPSPPPE
jgi:hypothetical protein